MPSIASLILLIVAFFSPIFSVNFLGENVGIGNFYTAAKTTIANPVIGISLFMIVMFFVAISLYAISAAGFNSRKIGPVASIATVFYLIIFFIGVSEMGGSFANAGLNIYLSLAAVVAYFWIDRR